MGHREGTMAVGLIIIVVVACVAVYVLQRSKSQRPVGAFRSSSDSAAPWLVSHEADAGNGGDASDSSDGGDGGSGAESDGSK
jgi:hypothetical protein